ncbi:tau-tubulin kinase 1 [Anaeramoeba flamelloides]|uniref:non-specific serine/threonine protein kinase n=1 Tax=Anaeramoeba flamelloides TaxID=1746091 RepID=A0ABQ8XF93_9EUKA|nr:tau-tubulin kinase 1 [Anaeramoeba flamelloides]
MLTGSIRGRWKLGKRIGKGGFGEIYLSQDLKTKMPVAIKFEKINPKKQVLKIEIAILRKLQVSPYVPKFVYYGRNLEYTYLIMELLGSNLSVERRRRSNHKFSLATTTKLGIEMIDAIEDMHKLGFIHRDIKPSNFVLRRRDPLTKSIESTSKTTICMIDFGLSRKYLDREGNLKPPRPKVGFQGTSRYASINSHEGKELSRRDDLWTLLYLFVEFLKGELPWSPIKDKLIIYKLKKKFNSSGLLKGLPGQFSKILEHIKSLRYEDEPNYNYLRELLIEVYKEAGYDENTKFDWEIEDLTRNKKSSQRSYRHNRKGINNRQRRKRRIKKYQHQRKNINIHTNRNMDMNKDMKNSQYDQMMEKKKSNDNNQNQNSLSKEPLDPNALTGSLTKTAIKTKKKKKKNVIMNKEFLRDIQKMNEIVIPSREELKRRQKMKGQSCVPQKREGPKVVINPKKNGTDFFDLIEANHRNEIYEKVPDYALMIKKIEEDMEIKKAKKKNFPFLKQKNEIPNKKEKTKSKQNNNDINQNYINEKDQNKEKLDPNLFNEKKESKFHDPFNFVLSQLQNNSSESETIDKKSCRCVIQ